METHLAQWLAQSPEGQEAESILRSCVHCGFCTATCPTYQLLGNELDGPRGRIYLIKQVAEGVEPTRDTQQHLDRCLTCRNCESTCPSGVRYGRLVDLGRGWVEERVRRPLAQRSVRWALREFLTRPWLFSPAMRLGQAVRPLLPAAIRAKVPARRDPGVWPQRSHVRKVMLLEGCVQPAMMPNINAATARVLDRLEIELVRMPQAGCCGAIRHHLNDHAGALEAARRNLDAWWPALESGSVEAILVNASGCTVMVKDYATLLQHDPAYAEKARRVVALTRDLSEFLPGESARLTEMLGAAPIRAVFHPPCTLQHGQQIRGAVEGLLTALGVQLAPVAESHLCCGSAGTYSVTQPELSRELRERKLGHLQASAPELILSANIGCLAHLQAGTETPVRHWVEWLDQALDKSAALSA